MWFRIFLLAKPTKYCLNERSKLSSNRAKRGAAKLYEQSEIRERASQALPKPSKPSYERKASRGQFQSLRVKRAHRVSVAGSSIERATCRLQNLANQAQSVRAKRASQAKRSLRKSTKSKQTKQTKQLAQIKQS